ncbi:MAG: hypothetical protein MHM6MM_000584 [Cercozoa sp. M6MM]
MLSDVTNRRSFLPTPKGARPHVREQEIYEVNVKLLRAIERDDFRLLLNTLRSCDPRKVVDLRTGDLNRTLLHHAAQLGQRTVHVTALLMHGANGRLHDINGDSPLTVAVRSGCFSTVHVLCEFYELQETRMTLLRNDDFTVTVECTETSATALIKHETRS